MPRYSVIASTGRTVAKGLYHLPYLPLIGGHDGQTLVPAGSFILDRDLERIGWTANPSSGIYLHHGDVFELPREEGYRGCCGPSGGDKNILDPDTLEPIAFEFADCYSAHYIRFAKGEYSLNIESPEQPECMVGFVVYRGMRQLVGVACGRTEGEAKKRLLPLCETQREDQAHCTSRFPEIMQLPIETMKAKQYLQQLDTKEPKWLFLKY